MKRTELLEFYTKMHREGYTRTDGKLIPADQAFASFELVRFMEFIDHSIFTNATILDYGAGKSNWNRQKYKGFPLKEILKYREIQTYEPSTEDVINSGHRYDVIIMMDVLEHVYISDIFDTLTGALRLCTGHFICNIATYKAMAQLPNGENAHITIRPPAWWLGLMEIISHNFPLIEITLFLSHNYNSASKFVFKGRLVQDQVTFETTEPKALMDINLRDSTSRVL